MKYQDHIKALQAQYFQKYYELRQLYPAKKGKEIWEMCESHFDFRMYSTYNCFRTSLYVFNKKTRASCPKE